MNLWSHIRSFMYSSAIVGMGLMIISSGLYLGQFSTAPVDPGVLLIIGLFFIAKVGLFAGQAHPEVVYSKEPLDPRFSWWWLLAAIVGALGIQFGSSWLHELIVPEPPVEGLLPNNLPLFLKWLTIGLIFPVFEEIGFRQVLWNNIKRAGKWLGVEDERQLTTLAAIYTVNIFLVAHIPAHGAESTMFLLPITLFFTLLRERTGGIFTSSIAHVVFNTTAVLLASGA